VGCPRYSTPEYRSVFVRISWPVVGRLNTADERRSWLPLTLITLRPPLIPVALRQVDGAVEPLVGRPRALPPPPLPPPAGGSVRAVQSHWVDQRLQQSSGWLCGVRFLTVLYM
jgi:hypothetical protein